MYRFCCVLALSVMAIAACDGPSAPPGPFLVQPGEATVLVGDSVQLSVSGGSGALEWTSLHPEVALVSALGVVRGLASGSAKITASEAARHASATVSVLDRAVLDGPDSLIVFETSPPEPAPPSMALTISNVGEAPLIDVRADVAYEGTTNRWLDARVDTTLGAVQLTLSPDASGIPIGTHAASVSVSAKKAENSPLSIPVRLSVVEPGRIVLDRDTLRVGALVGETAKTARVPVRNDGARSFGALSTNIEYPSGAPVGWLNSTLGDGHLEVDASAASLGEGTQYATVWVQSDLSFVDPAPLRVEFDVGPQPSIHISPTSIAFYALQDSIDPLPQTIDVTNGGGGTLSGLTLSAPRYGPGANGWLQASLSAVAAPARIKLHASIGGLAGGTYYADVDVEATSADSPRAFRVVLTVEGPWIYLVSNGTTIRAARGTVRGPGFYPIYNGGGGVLSGLQLTVNETGPPGFAIIGFNGPPVAPVSVLVSANGVGVPAGSYFAEVIISSTLPNVRPDTMVFNIRIAPEPKIVLTPTSLSLNVAAGTVGSPDSLAITNGGGGFLNVLTPGVIYPAGGPTGWLNASIPYTAIVRYHVDATALAPGTYTATLRVGSPQPLVQSVFVPVTLVVR